MKEFISHIDYLIQKHDCVIIPDFGGFVLNHEDASFAYNGSALPPKVTIGFNPGLKHNDGLLAESYMSVYSISYDEASKQIDESVKRLNTILRMKHPVQIGRLGKLALDKSSKLVFTPNENLSIFHPETFGLSAVNLRRLTDIDMEQAKIKRKLIYKRTLSGVGAAAAAVLLFFIASTPVSDHNNTQKSSLFTDLISAATVNSSKEVPAEIKVEEAVLPNSRTIKSSDLGTEKSEIKTVKSIRENDIQENDLKNEVGEELGVNHPQYFVIIASAGSQSEARKLADRVKSEGLPTASILPSGGRVRIYANSFSSRSEAEIYLASLKKNNLQHQDAWIYFKKQ